MRVISFILIKIHLIMAPVVMVPWTMPPIIGPMMACGWDWRVGVWSAIELVIAGMIYYPFFKAAEKQMLIKERGDASQD